ncbi:hypothetical protein Tco_1133787 [Tanacetum coccineum]
MGLPSTKRKEFSSSGFKRLSSVVKSKGDSKEREKGTKEILEDQDEVVSVCLWDMDEEVEETLVGWLSGKVDPLVCQGAIMVILGLLRARNKIEADMMVLVIMLPIPPGLLLLNFVRFRLELFVMALRQLVPIVIREPPFWVEFRLGDGLTLLDLVQSALRPSFSEREKGAKVTLEDWDEVVSSGTSVWVDPHVCQGAMMVILGLLRVRNKMEADMMVLVQANRNLKKPNLGLGMGLPSTKREEFSLSGFKRSSSVVKSKGESEEREKGAKEMLEDWDDVVSGGPSLLDLVQSAMRPSLSEREKGAKGMLEDWDEVVSGGPHPSRVCLWDMEEEVEETLVGWLYNGDFHMRFFFDWVDPPVCQGAMMVILGLLRARNKMEADMMVLVQANRNLKKVCLWDMEEEVEETLVGWLYNGDFHMRFFFDWVDPPVCQGAMMVILGLLSARNKMEAGMMVLVQANRNLKKVCLWDMDEELFAGQVGDFHMRFFFDWVDPSVCQGAMMVIQGLLSARNKVEAGMMVLVQANRNLKNFALFCLELFVTALRQLVPIVILEPPFWSKFELGDGLTLLESVLICDKRSSFSELGEGGGKGMLEDWDESLFVGYGGGVVGSGPILPMRTELSGAGEEGEGVFLFVCGIWKGSWNDDVDTSGKRRYNDQKTTRELRCHEDFPHPKRPSLTLPEVLHPISGRRYPRTPEGHRSRKLLQQIGAIRGTQLLNYHKLRMTGPISDPTTSVNRVDTNEPTDSPNIQEQILNHISSLKALVQLHNESPTGSVKPIRLTFDDEEQPAEKLEEPEDLRKPYKEKYAELSAAEKIQADCDMKATNIILQGLPADIYSLVNHHRVAKDLWERVQLLMQGTSLTKQERECKLYDAFDKFTHIKGESLHTYYLRFTQLINDMNIYKMKMEQFQVNTKFLNSLPPEWSKFVTDVKLVKDFHTSNFDQLHAYLKQYELHANEVRIMHERNQDPLAFVVNQQMTPPHFNPYQSSYNNPQLQQQFSPSQYGSIQLNQHYSSTYPSQPQLNHSSIPPSHTYQSQMNHQTSYVLQAIPHVAYQSPLAPTQLMIESPFVDSGFAVPVFSPRDDPIASLNKAMAFLTVVASSRFPSTNNQLRTSFNPRNQATIQDAQKEILQLDRQDLLNAITSKVKDIWLGNALSLSDQVMQRDLEVPTSQAQIIIPHNAAFQTEDLDTYDSDYDDLSIAQAVLMANISTYGSDVISEVPNSIKSVCGIYT